MEITCPVCGCEFCLDYEILDQHILCEEWGKCPACGQYGYEFHYGHTYVDIGDYGFEWSYTDSADTVQSIQREINVACNTVSELYEKLENYSHG